MGKRFNPLDSLVCKNGSNAPTLQPAGCVRTEITRRLWAHSTHWFGVPARQQFPLPPPSLHFNFSLESGLIRRRPARAALGVERARATHPLRLPFPPPGPHPFRGSGGGSRVPVSTWAGRPQAQRTVPPRVASPGRPQSQRPCAAAERTGLGAAGRTLRGAAD